MMGVTTTSSFEVHLKYMVLTLGVIWVCLWVCEGWTDMIPRCFVCYSGGVDEFVVCSNLVAFSLAE